MAQKRTEYWREWERKNRARRNEYHRNLYRKTKNKTIKGGNKMNEIENFIFDFFQYPAVNELINTKEEAIEIEKILRKLLTHYITTNKK